MDKLNKVLVFLICASLLSMNLPYAAKAGYYAKTNTGITEKPPQVSSTPAENIPIVQPSKESEKSGGKWLWVGLGVAILVVAVAAFAGGGSDSGGNGEDPGTGNISASW